jgi:3-hydroxyethyl bacteriochlorophyllide a dehydrogenase
MKSTAVVFQAPGDLALRTFALPALQAGDALVDVECSGISTGTERLLWTGAMPPFPGLAYPLIPGYESVGRVVELAAGDTSGLAVGDRVFVPGATCFTDASCLFGGTASRLVVATSKVTRVPAGLGEEACLLALAATAQHALGESGTCDLIIGHGVLGRLLARLVVAAGHDVVVHETNPARASGAVGYRVLSPNDDPRRDYRRIVDVSGDSAIIDSLVRRIARGGEIVLAGFYAEPMQFTFPMAFMKEVRLQVAAEWKPADLEVVLAHLASGALKLDGLITHRRTADHAKDAYATAFGDVSCLKMLIDWTAP